MKDVQKIGLIEALAQRLGWLIKALSKNQNGSDFLHESGLYRVDLLVVRIDDSTQPSPASSKLLGMVKDKFPEVSCYIITYNLIKDSFGVSIMTPSAGHYNDTNSEIADWLDVMLSEISADQIRQAFSAHERLFFKISGTTALDWRLDR